MYYLFIYLLVVVTQHWFGQVTAVSWPETVSHLMLNASLQQI